ncbi:hypothetical protein [Halorientalis pallida]|uniref:Uncharacterized protein n=1 Tax=Halorientalis pallida TaxID=2479928 RepID=A0A498KTA0_9EURY|nr:hypothetical protein [Halorientalis pallida]RXK46419.1 hypothetical protein EAF64_19205 [Halorientalis pallida]
MRATLTDEAGDSVGPLEIQFVCHPGLLHYGRNLQLPGDGTYTVRSRPTVPERPSIRTYRNFY